MPRKGENIYKRKDGRWEGRFIKSRNPETGKIQYGSIYGSSYQEVKEALILKKGQPYQQASATKAFTLGQWLSYWLEEETAPFIKHSTYASYCVLIESHILPELGDIRLLQLTTAMIQQYLRHKGQQGRLDGTGPLSAKTVQTIAQILKTSLKCAVEKGLIIKNPALGVKCPKPGKKPVRVLSLAEQRQLEAAVLQSKREEMIGVIVCLYAGLRIGELCALQWKDIDLSAGTISINKTMLRTRAKIPDQEGKTEIIIDSPKSIYSIRIIPISAGLIQVMRRYYDTRQAADRKPESYFISRNGKFIEPRLYQKYFTQLLQEAMLPAFNFHALRHTFATRCIELNMDVKSLSEILGHGSVTITLNTYVHSFEEQQRLSMNRLDTLLYEKDLSAS